MLYKIYNFTYIYLCKYNGEFMVKNRTGQLIFETVYIVLGLIGVLGSMGYFSKQFISDFFIYYTNISNYICLGVMIKSFLTTIKNSNENTNEYKISSKLHFVCTVIIIMTFLVYNSSLFLDLKIGDYALSLSSLCFHLFLPIMFTVHYFLYCVKEPLSWSDPFLTIILPITYVIFIELRAIIFPNVETKYPYFFLNIQRLGAIKFFYWILLLIFIMILISYMIMFINSFRWSRKLRKAR